MGGYCVFVGNGFDDVCIDIVECSGSETIPCVSSVSDANGSMSMSINIGWKEMIQALRCALSVELDDGLVVVEAVQEVVGVSLYLLEIVGDEGFLE